MAMSKSKTVETFEESQMEDSQVEDSQVDLDSELGGFHFCAFGEPMPSSQLDDDSSEETIVLGQDKKSSSGHKKDKKAMTIEYGGGYGPGSVTPGLFGQLFSHLMTKEQLQHYQDGLKEHLTEHGALQEPDPFAAASSSAGAPETVVGNGKEDKQKKAKRKGKKTQIAHKRK